MDPHIRKEVSLDAKGKNHDFQAVKRIRTRIWFENKVHLRSAGNRKRVIFSCISNIRPPFPRRLGKNGTERARDHFSLLFHFRWFFYAHNIHATSAYFSWKHSIQVWNHFILGLSLPLDCSYVRRGLTFQSAKGPFVNHFKWIMHIMSNLRK